MTQPYRERSYEVAYHGWRDEGMILARTTQRYRGVSRLGLADGKVRFLSMYGLKPTPFADHLMLALYELHLTMRIRGEQDKGH